MSKRATIVSPHRLWGYVAAIVGGTIHSYHPASATIWRPAARWAKAAGDAKIRRCEKQKQRERRRENRARMATGYGGES